MFENEIKPFRTDTNLTDYAGTCRSFAWDDANPLFSWHATGRLNIAHEAIDRHAGDPRRADSACLTFSHGERRETLTYADMRRLSNRCAGMLLRLGIGQGDVVFLFLPSCPEMYIAMAGCAKIGAIIAPLYSDYREAAVRARMQDGCAAALITDERHLARVPVDDVATLRAIVLTGDCPAGTPGRARSWAEEMARSSDDLTPVWVNRDRPLLLIYTSGPDGRPVGLVHAHDAMRGYLMTARWVLDLRDGDVLWTQGRPGWFLNAAYSAFAPWLCGVESFVSGRMDSAEEMLRLIEENRVSVLYTVPAMYRMLADAGKETAQRFDLKRLRHLLSVLEPLLPGDIYAVMRVLGLPVYDTWWSAETGMITIANLPCLPIKPGYLGRPVPGITAAVLDGEGRAAPPFTMGRLALKAPWPAMAAGVWRRPELYRCYFEQPPWFMTGDTAFMDHDRYLYYQGRADDVIITPAGKVAIAEIEHALEEHPAVREAGLVRAAGRHGTQLKAYVHLRTAEDAGAGLEHELREYLARKFSPDITPREIVFCGRLPRDAGGRLLRMVLKAWELGLPVGNLDRA